MDLAEIFAHALPEAMASLVNDEWVLTTTRKKMVSETTADEAFSNVVGILKLALIQSDQYAFASCCWLARDLAERSATTQIPEGLEDALEALVVVARLNGTSAEIAPLFAWYRLPLNRPLHPTAFGVG